MRALKKNEKVGLGIVGIGGLGVIYMMGGKEESEIGGGGFTGGVGGPPLFDESITTKKDVVPSEGFSVFQPFTDTKSSVLPTIKDYDSWRESIKRPDAPKPVKKTVSIPVVKPRERKKINPVFDAIFTVTDPTLPIAATAAKFTVDKYIPAKKESIAKAKEIPVSNISTVLAKSKTEKKSFWSTLASMVTSDNIKKTPANARQKTIALETAGKTAAFGPGAVINMLKAAGVKTPATKKQKIGALQTAGYTAAFGHGAGVASAINNAFNMPSTRKPKFSATAARYGGAFAGYGRGYTSTKKGGAVVSRTSTGWSGGSTRDRMDVATKAGVHGLSYR